MSFIVTYISTFKEYRRLAIFFHCFFSILAISIIIYFVFLRAPTNFTEGTIFKLEKGKTLSETAQLLEKQNIVLSSFWFKKVVISLKGEGKIKAGDYFFEKPQTAYAIAKRIINGKFDLTPIKVTIPEGYSISEMADIFDKRLPEFDKEKFITLASQKEGYLFPDTYLFSPKIKVENIIKTLEDNFKLRIEGIKDEIENFNKPLNEIITMASIIERESKTMESRKIISGILWKRLEIGMPLQVDVTFSYINGKNTFDLTYDDLKIDSPYNTYNRIGLPPTPISNPGINAILATIHPDITDYLYFLSDQSDNMHYAKTHNEHIQNKNLYLNN